MTPVNHPLSVSCELVAYWPMYPLWLLTPFPVFSDGLGPGGLVVGELGSGFQFTICRSNHVAAKRGSRPTPRFFDYFLFFRCTLPSHQETCNPAWSPQNWAALRSPAKSSTVSGQLETASLNTKQNKKDERWLWSHPEKDPGPTQAPVPVPSPRDSEAQGGREPRPARAQQRREQRGRQRCQEELPQQTALTTTRETTGPRQEEKKEEENQG